MLLAMTLNDRLFMKLCLGDRIGEQMTTDNRNYNDEVE